MERLEAFVSRAIEGWSARLFGAKLQPVQIARRLIRTMEAHQTISLSKTFVPNSYVVSLSATDFAQFEQYRRSLERDLAEAVLTAVINKRAGGMGLIAGRKVFQRPIKEGVELLQAIQDVYLCREVTVA